MIDPIVEHCLKSYDQLVSGRTNWDSHWKDVSDYVIPRKNDIYMSRTKGEKKQGEVYDCTAVHANELLASALHGMLTNPAISWFGLSSGDPMVDSKREIRLFLQNAVHLMHQVLNDISNFQTEVHESYLDLGSLGTAPLRMEERNDAKLIHFSSRPVNEMYLAENHYGEIDTMFRLVKYSGKKMLDKFGKDAFTEEDKSILEKDFYSEHDVLHIIKPRKEFDTDKKGGKHKPFASYYIWQDKKKLLSESGFDEFPYAIPRWTKISGETYGRSPGMKALGDIKMINTMMKTTIRGAQKIVDPPLQVPDDGMVLPIRTVPGGTNYYRAGSKDRIEPMMTGGRPDIGIQVMEDVRIRIRQAFFIDQLQLKDGPQMTATEVMQRTEEQLRMLGPILGRLHHELLKPIIDRTFAIMLRRKEFGAIPGELQGRDLSIKYSSMIARAQRSSEAENITRSLNVVMPLMQADPTILDNINGDAVLKHSANIFNVPEEIFRSDKEVKELRGARQEREQTAMDQQEQMNEAETVNKMAQAGK